MQKQPHFIHGMTGTHIYMVWKTMKTRCLNPNFQDYKNYGGRGITVCDRWQTFEGFYKDMGSTHNDGLTLDRINNNGNYEKSNCRWVSRKDQAINRRTSRLLTFNGKTQTVRQWAKDIGMSEKGLAGRLTHNWSIEKALTTPNLSIYKIAT